jgi:hypothetical protein
MKNQIKIKDSFIIYRSFIDAIKSLPDVERLQIFDAISDYALDGKEAVLSGISYTVFTLIKPQLDANRKRFENGCKDKKKSKPEAKPKRTRSKPEANDNVNDNPNPNLNLESEFELFWQSYKPIHTSKGNKEKSKTLFLKALKTTPLESIKNGLAEYMSHCHSKNSYTKSVEVWLKNQCWNDDNKLISIPQDQWNKTYGFRGRPSIIDLIDILSGERPLSDLEKIEANKKNEKRMRLYAAEISSIWLDDKYYNLENAFLDRYRNHNNIHLKNIIDEFLGIKEYLIDSRVKNMALHLRTHLIADKMVFFDKLIGIAKKQNPQKYKIEVQKLNLVRLPTLPTLKKI